MAVENCTVEVELLVQVLVLERLVQETALALERPSLVGARPFAH